MNSSSAGRFPLPKGPVEEHLIPKVKDLAGFFVRRSLPMPRRRHIGPFVFFDDMGPASFGLNAGIDIRPHPHIGLATITYLFQGSILHRDSLGTRKLIQPGAINWMVAGSGIVHSERPGEGNAWRSTVHGLQLWVALPVEEEDGEPSFTHVPANDVPERIIAGASIRALIGTPLGIAGGVKGTSPMGYADLSLSEESSLTVSAEFSERAIYATSGTVHIESRSGVFHLAEQQMAVLRAGETVQLKGGARAVYIAGEPHPEPRYMDWNFVSSRPARIEQAKQRWRDDAFPRVPGDEEERILLPE